MEKVYIVTSGDYSEYRIEAVFTTKELAEDYVLHNGVDFDIAEYDVDEPFERGDVLWKVRLNIDTHEEKGCSATDNEGYKDLMIYDDCTCSGECLTFWIVADTSERAIKVANERLNQVKAGAMMFYREVFRRHRDRWGSTYKYVDYHTGQTANPLERKERR